jgi:ankyrin repeat protein
VRVLLRSIGLAGLLLAGQLSPAGAAGPPLLDAVMRRDAAAVATLLGQKVDVNAGRADGVTPLHWAVHQDDRTMADLLLNAGARASAVDDTGVSPLYLACTNRNTEMVGRLLRAGGDPNAALLNGETVLMNCARSGDAQSVKALIAAGAKVNAREKSHDQTALMWAAAEAHPDAVAELLQGGGDVRARSRVYPQTVTGEQTQRAGREELNYTVQRGGSTPLLFAARSGDAASARLLLAAGADVNDTLPSGMSALVLAAHSGHSEVALLLLEKGADPNAAGIGYSALHAAVLRSELDVVKSLLAHGANPRAVVMKGTPIRRNTTDYNLPATLIGATPYLLAARFLEPEIMRALVEGGAEPSATMKDGTTAIQLAAGVGANATANRRGVEVLDGGQLDDPRRVPEAVRAALDAGADVTSANAAGETALHAASFLGLDAVVRLLVEHGAPVNVRNKRGLTPLALASGAASRRGTSGGAGDLAPLEHPSTVELLKTLGATE